MKEWFTAAELASLKLPLLPTTTSAVIRRAKVDCWQHPDRQWPRDPDGTWRRRDGRGGGIEYHLRALPMMARARLAVDQHLDAAAASADAAGDRADAKAELTRDEMWAWFDRLPDRRKEIARQRLAALDTVETMERTGVPRDISMSVVAPKIGVSLRTLYNWLTLAHGVERCDWLPYLAPRHVGSTGRNVGCDPEAWDWLKGAWLRVERPSFTSCYRQLQRVAVERGWQVAPARTMERWLGKLHLTVRVLAREGEDALKRMYPAQERDRSVFHALEGVNADGHRWDVWVRWPDGEVLRPMMVVFQDLYSGKILSWRVDKSENKEAVRLALGDLVETYGIPDHVWLDNGRHFASKMISGRSPTRYRFKVREEEPAGILEQLGTAVHFTTPYSGQSKPIERAFRDFCDAIAKDPRFHGAWTGNSPVNKPENYGSKAIALETFLQVAADGIAEHNARLGRRGGVCEGRSFDHTFLDSYRQAPIRKATEAQRRLWLLAAEGVRARHDGSIELLGNRYWAERLVEHAGEKLIVRFDPQELHGEAHAYRLDGSFIVTAPCIEAVGFADADAARAHARARKHWLKAQAEMLAAERTLSIDEVAAMIPADTTIYAAPEARVVRPVFGNVALKPAAVPAADELPQDDRFRDGLRNFLQIVRDENDAGRG